MKKVGKSKVSVGDKLRNFAYRDIDFDKDGWVDASKYMPIDYDLVFLKIEGKRSVSGWSSGNGWDGLKFNEASKVTHWKRKFEEKDEI